MLFKGAIFFMNGCVLCVCSHLRSPVDQSFLWKQSWHCSLFLLGTTSLCAQAPWQSTLFTYAEKQSFHTLGSLPPRPAITMRYKLCKTARISVVPKAVVTGLLRFSLVSGTICCVREVTSGWFRV